jgi:hypothetical protein
MLFAGVAIVPKPPRITGDLTFWRGSLTGSLSGVTSGVLSDDAMAYSYPRVLSIKGLYVDTVERSVSNPDGTI